VKRKLSAAQKLIRAVLPVLAAGAAALGLSRAAFAQARPTTPAGATTTASSPFAASRPLAGRIVEEVRIRGNNAVSTAAIRNLIRTREGDRFDPATVEEDYQRVFGLRKFANVEARVEPTATGVVVVFEVTEQKQIQDIRFRGNTALDEKTLRQAIEIGAGESIDRFRINLARQTIERLYKDRNHPFAHVEVPADELAQGRVVFQITEGPNVRVRKVRVFGNRSFSDERLEEQLKTKAWIFIFQAGTFDPDQIDEDVAALRQFYEQHGFFDARVGRKLDWSADQSEVMVTFEVDEGVRYKVDQVTFRGNTALSEADLRKNLKLLEGRYFDGDILRRDLRQIVRAYSPFGYIYQPNEPDTERSAQYLKIVPEQVFRREAGKVGIVYDIREGRPYHIDRVMVRGNDRVQDKVFLRELRVHPGDLYNAGEVADAQDRIRGTRLVNNVQITPIGDKPDSRDLLIEVVEAQTAIFMFGAGITSNAGILGNITYEQRNFDIANVPTSWSELFSTKGFTGAGQLFRVNIEPGTELSRARVTFEEPWIFDQPYSFRGDAYYQTRRREEYDETRGGGSLTLGHRFNNEWTGRISLKGEDVLIHNVDDRFHRALEILEFEGHSTLTSTTLAVRRDTTDSRVFPTRGSVVDAAWEYAGAIGGDFEFHKFTVGWNYYQTIYEDLLDRRTILSYRADAGYITGDAPFFERFYAGGLGSVRGFRYRGISPRSGLEEDAVGGDFILTGSVELNFPVAGEMLRGVVFADAGTVERDLSFGTIRSSVGVGIRLTLPIFTQLPLALDFAVPITKDEQDDTRFISFSLGFIP
jgi:outer membrane protein assembly factor BamA